MTARHVDPGGSEFNVDLHFATERMARLHDEAHVARRTARRGAGILTGLRERLGRSLIALGSAIAPDRPFVSGPVRRP
jgi:hypothetical protein